jgi:hypothetical protein
VGECEWLEDRVERLGDKLAVEGSRGSP